MRTHNFIIFFILITIFSCKQKYKSDSNTIQEPARFERLKVNNPDIDTYLGVGLWAMPLPVDYDKDGDLDLLVSCTDKPWNGTYFFENTTGESFPVFKAPVKVGKAMKHIQISYVNGKSRFLIPGKELLDFTTLFSDEKVKELFPDNFDQLHKKIRFNQWKYVDYEGDGDLDIIVGIQDGEDYGWDGGFDKNGKWLSGPLHGYVYLIENVNGKYELKDKILAGGKPIDVYGIPSPNFSDFDNDGDLDIICGEFIDKFTWFENIGTRKNPKYSKGRYLKNDNGIITMDLEMIMPVALDWDKDGDTDLIVGDEDGRVAFMENTGKSKNNMPLFRSPRYFRQESEYLKFGALVSPFSTDWDEDGDEDLICGNSAGYIGFIENLDGGDTPKWAEPVKLKADGKTIRIQAGENGSIQGPCESKWGYTTLSVADWNNDGLKDIIVNSIWGKIIWYENIGTKQKPELAKAKPVLIKSKEVISKPSWYWWDPEPETLITQWRTTPNAIDWNKDGLMDLVMLDHEGYLAFYERFKLNNKLYLKPGKRIFYSVNGTFNRKNKKISNKGSLLRLSEGINGKSGRRKLAFTDWDGDGDLDIIINGRNAVLVENIGTKNGMVQMKIHGNFSDLKLAGHSTDPTLVDWDNNNVPDLLLGAEDGCFYYWKNK